MIVKAVAGSLTGPRRSGGARSVPSRQVVLADQRVDLSRWARYARVCEMRVGTTLPGTFLHVMAFALQVKVMAAPDFPFPMLGMVHVANEMQMFAGVGLDETLTFTAWADSVRPHRHGATVDLHARAENGSQVVWRGRSTYLVRGADLGGTASDPAPEGDPTSGGVGAVPLPAWAHLSLASDLGRRYAAASGDVNPIHLHPLAARMLGFPRTIAHGMWTHARVLALLEGRVPPRHRMAVSFRKPILLPSTAVLRARPTHDGHDFAVTDDTGDRQHLVGSIHALR
ncbi:MAG: MaoC/PaaZ C-terminal domain-containing protein [Ornithinimicrobium sp.]